jgi:hypothetical protein
MEDPDQLVTGGPDESPGPQFPLWEAYRDEAVMLAAALKREGYTVAWIEGGRIDPKKRLGNGSQDPPEGGSAP